MNDNCSHCGTRRYIDPPLPGKVSKVMCSECLYSVDYVWCQLHDKICVLSAGCVPSNKSAFEHNYMKTNNTTTSKSEKDLLNKLIVNLANLEEKFSKRFDQIDRKLEDFENMIKYSVGSEIYNSTKADFEKLQN
jgi:hypothetical protein